MFKISRRKAAGFVILAVTLCSLWYLVQGPSMARSQNAEIEAAIQLSIPGAPNTVDVFRDPSDTAMSKVQQGSTAAAVSFDGDLRSLPQIGPEEKSLGIEFEMMEMERPNPNFTDPVRQEFRAPDAMPGPSQNFAGLDLTNWGAGWPPDTNGDVGPNHYIQTVNTSIGIYTKTGTRLAAFTFNTLFDGTGTPCDANNNGDPVVLYDNVSGRWIITDLAGQTSKMGLITNVSPYPKRPILFPAAGGSTGYGPMTPPIPG